MTGPWPRKHKSFIRAKWEPTLIASDWAVLLVKAKHPGSPKHSALRPKLNVSNKERISTGKAEGYPESFLSFIFCEFLKISKGNVCYLGFRKK